MRSEAKNLIIVLGPTAVGKSATAIRLAKKFKGEIINCDSMQVYRGFDIGTDKIQPDRREDIPHHLIDVADPSEQFTAAEFVRQAMAAVESIRKKRKIPIVAGGTGLYLKALLDGLFPEEGKDPKIRDWLEYQAKEMGLDFLRKKLLEVDPVYAKKIGEKDKVRIIRALEVFTATGKPISDLFKSTKSQVDDFHILKIGLKLERHAIYEKIEVRVDRMFERGIVKEVRNLLEEGIGPDSPPFRALGYSQVLKHLNGDLSLEEAIDQAKKETRHYAKRQLTWFRKMTGVSWFSPDDFPAISAFVKAHLK